MTPEDKEQYIREYIAITRQHFSTYHNHKEQMAYIATGLYLTAASALFFRKPLNVTDKLTYQCIIIIFAFLFSIAAFEFVRWQIALRRIANDIIAACDFLRLTRLQDCYAEPDAIPITYWRSGLKIDMPLCVFTELSNLRSTQALERLKVLTLGPILLGMVALIGRLIVLPP